MSRLLAADLTRTVRKALQSSFPDVGFQIEFGTILNRLKEPLTRGHVAWTNGPAIEAVREALRPAATAMPDDVRYFCLRTYTPEWVGAMSEAHGLKVKVAISGYDHTALIHPYDATPESDRARAQLITLLDRCTAPMQHNRKEGKTCPTN